MAKSARDINKTKFIQIMELISRTDDSLHLRIQWFHPLIWTVFILHSLAGISLKDN